MMDFYQLSANVDSNGNISPNVPGAVDWVGVYASGSYIVAVQSGASIPQGIKLASGDKGTLNEYYFLPASGSMVQNSGFSQDLLNACTAVGLTYADVITWEID